MEPFRDRDVDEAVEETFPASDAPANTVETGIRSGELPTSPDLAISDNHSQNRFETTIDGSTAFLVYERYENALNIVHTEVPESLRGRHVGQALVDHAVRTARSTGLQIIATCPFARGYLRKHPPAQS